MASVSTARELQKDCCGVSGSGALRAITANVDRRSGAGIDQVDISILIIDGQPQVRDLLASRLDRQPGLAVVAKTSNLFVGADLIQDWQPHVVLADIRLPSKDRAETCRWLNGVSPHSKLVLLTSFFREGEELACLRAGASRCLLKGVSIEQLICELLNVSRASLG